MNTAIDNFGVVANELLKFDNEGEFYLLLVLRRRKDVKGAVREGVNEDNRLIKHFFIYDKDYFERKMDAIVNLCEQNNARAYILPQRRTCKLVLWELLDKVVAILKSGTMNVHFDHLIRTCVAGMHEVPPYCKHHKRWVLDIDADDQDTLDVIKAWDGQLKPLYDVGAYAQWIANRITEALQSPSAGQHRTADAVEFMPTLKAYHQLPIVTVLPTPHGFHIVTPPFNRDQKAMDKYFGKGAPRQEWIKPDAMALLYAAVGIGG